MTNKIVDFKTIYDEWKQYSALGTVEEFAALKKFAESVKRDYTEIDKVCCHIASLDHALAAAKGG